MQHPVYSHTSSINADGSRKLIHPADVRGPFTYLRNGAFIILLVIFVTAPLVKIRGNPLLFLDITNRHFYILGFTFNAQDVYLVFFFLTGGAFLLFFLTAIAGRVWCGWTCPQTVFLEGVFRKIERWIEGPRSQRLKLANQPTNLKKALKRALKHTLFVLVSFAITITLLRYFVSSQDIRDLFVAAPSNHPILFFWFVFLTVIIYLNFSWFREQLCLIVCPYGRLQSALIDDDSLVIGYDKKRGEPRGKKNSSQRGDCIDCKRCVFVCPTGIDIRNGLQMECIGCANCIDACDEIMKKINQPQGLIRYDSLNGLEGNKKRFLRPRLYLYAALLVVGAVVASSFMLARSNIEVNLVRLPGAPYVLTDTTIRNQYELHLFNKSTEPMTLTINPRISPDVTFILPIKEFTLEGLKDRRLPFFVEKPQSKFTNEFEIALDVRGKKSKEIISKSIPFLGP